MNLGIKDLDKRRWIVLIAGCFINLCLGSIYVWSVFSAGMADYFTNTLGKTVTSADLAIVYTIANSVGPITMISGGWFNDKFGPRKVILIGGIMWGLGMFLSGFTTSVNGLILTYGLIGGLGLGMAYGSTISTCVKFFPDKRGLVGGITTAVYGLSSVILPPIVTVIVSKTNATTAFKIVGVVFMVLIAVSVIFLEKCPDDYTPAGFTPKKTAAVKQNMNWKEMLKTPTFYVMLLLLTCGAFTGMMITSQASSVAQHMVGLSAVAASLAVSVLALFNALGRIVAGFVSDKIGRINTLFLACILAVIGLLCLYFSGMGTVILFYIGLSIVGISYGAFMGVYPGFTADQFGPKNNSVNYGIMFIGFAIAGYFGPQIMGTTFAKTGAYQDAFMYAIIFSCVGIVFTFIYRLVAKKNK
ncbi:L-lactate MFS transporter [Lachnospira sp.]|uniref:L-lactate MFS transporter n=1 Tax=Lachnospira sp. TaxID=2049031 RepID=UPI00257F4EC0|nr:OFA family MFS transporter [Lachnospira sp.]